MLSIILCRRNFREYDQLITLYTAERGKVEVLARGVKKITSKNTAHLEPYFLADVEVVPGKDILHLTKVQPVQIFKNIRCNLEKISMVGYALNLMDAFVQSGEKDIKLFGLLRNWLEFVDSTENVDLALLYSFTFKLLFLLGFKPELEKCVVCGADEKIGFYFAGGGVLCKKCVQEKLSLGKEIVLISKKEVDGLRVLLEEDWSSTLLITNSKVFKIIFRFAQYHTERKIHFFNGF